MGNLLGILFVYLIFRAIDIATDKNKKTSGDVKKTNKKRMTFAEFAEEIVNSIEEDARSKSKVKASTKTDMKELKRQLKEKHKDKILKPIVSSDKNIKMRHGEDSLEGVSLETNDAKDVCLNNNEVFDRFFTKQITEMESDRKNETKIAFGEKSLEVNDISGDELRKAVVFSEILSKPVSLR